MSRLKRVKNNTILSLLGSGLITAGALVKTIVLARFLEIEDFGYYVLCLNAVVILRLFLRPGFQPTLLRYIPEYEAEGSQDKVSSVVLLCIYISLVFFCVFTGLFFLGSGFIAKNIYGVSNLANPLMILGVSSGGYLFTSIVTSLLRVTENFKYTVIYSFTGAIATPLMLVLFLSSGELDLRLSIVATAVGEVVTSGSACLVCLFLLRKKFVFNRSILTLTPLTGHFVSLRGTLAQTSVFGILQAGAQAGGIFLLGVFGTAVQVAIGGMAIQMARPVAMFQTSLSAAVTPELNKIYASKNIESLFVFIKKYMIIISICVISGLCLVLLIGPPLIEKFLRPEYTEAIPAFLVLLVALGLNVVFQPFMVVAIARDEVGRRNLLLCCRFLYLGIAVCAGITAMGVMLALLAGNLTVRLLADYPLYRRLQKDAI